MKIMIHVHLEEQFESFKKDIYGHEMTTNGKIVFSLLLLKILLIFNLFSSIERFNSDFLFKL